MSDTNSTPKWQHSMNIVWTKAELYKLLFPDREFLMSHEGARKKAITRAFQHHIPAENWNEDVEVTITATVGRIHADCWVEQFAYTYAGQPGGSLNPNSTVASRHVEGLDRYSNLKDAEAALVKYLGGSARAAGLSRPQTVAALERILPHSPVGVRSFAEPDPIAVRGRIRELLDEFVEPEIEE